MTDTIRGERIFALGAVNLLEQSQPDTKAKLKGPRLANVLSMAHRQALPDEIEQMFDVMLCLPKTAWLCVLKELDKKIGTGALRKIILHACNDSNPQMLERLKRGVAILDRENKRKRRKLKGRTRRLERA